YIDQTGQVTSLSTPSGQQHIVQIQQLPSRPGFEVATQAFVTCTDGAESYVRVDTLTVDDVALIIGAAVYEPTQGAYATLTNYTREQKTYAVRAMPINNMALLLVIADEPVTCRYAENQVLYEQMSPFGSQTASQNQTQLVTINDQTQRQFY